MYQDRDRRELRLLRIQVRSKERGICDARLHNLSEHGLSATLESPATVGEQLIFELNGIGSVAGTVCWVHQNRVGVSLERAVDPAKVVREEPVADWTAPDYAKLLLTGAVSSRRPGLRTR
jgi:PilZ domain